MANNNSVFFYVEAFKRKSKRIGLFISSATLILFSSGCENGGGWTEKLIKNNIDSCLTETSDLGIDRTLLKPYCDCSVNALKESFSYEEFEKIKDGDIDYQQDVLSPVVKGCVEDLEERLGQRMSYFAEVSSCKESFYMRFDVDDSEAEEICECMVGAIDSKYTVEEKILHQENGIVDVNIRDSCVWCKLNMSIDSLEIRFSPSP